MKITNLRARQILDSRGVPTIETEVTLEGGVIGRSAVPGGTSSGEHEAVELRDGGVAYGGKGVSKAVEIINTTLLDELKNHDFDQISLDKKLNQLDGNDNKSQLGANTILSISLAFAWAASRTGFKPLYEYFGQLYENERFTLPRPMFNIMNGGSHGNWATDIQEFMAIPLKPISWAEKLKIGVEVFHQLETLLKGKGYNINVGKEGGFAPQLGSNQEALDLVCQAITSAGYQLGSDVGLGLDVAASEFFDKETKQYELKKDGRSLSTAEMIAWLMELTDRYPIVSIEDGLAEDDWAGWQLLTNRLGTNLQIVGDDLLTTNPDRIKQAIDQQACNALLVKPNQIGTLSETLSAMKLSQQAGWQNVVSHRSGETEDVTIAHLAVGTGAGQIKTGAPNRGERIAKYNELTRIAERVEPTI